MAMSSFASACAALTDDERRPIAIKVADLQHIYRRMGVDDPLESEALSPDTASRVYHHGQARGGHIGAIAGGLVGAGVGGLAGYGLGNAAGQALNWEGGQRAVSAPITGNGGYSLNDAGVGALTGAATGAAGALGGGLFGSYAGKQLGAGIGGMVSGHRAPTLLAAERIRQMDPSTGLAYIRNAERAGRTSPEEIQSMKDTYNARRDGLATQLQTNSSAYGTTPTKGGPTSLRIPY